MSAVVVSHRGGRFAFDRDLQSLTLITDAEKKRNYECVECREKIIFKKGAKVRPYFSHLANTRCKYFDVIAGMTEEHREAQRICSHKLANNETVSFEVKCARCHHICTTSEYTAPPNSTVKTELFAKHDEKRQFYDIAVLTSAGKVDLIVEIFHTSLTQSYRPEPWFEINAGEILQGSQTLTCVRLRPDHFCEACTIYNENEEKVERIKNACWYAEIPHEKRVCHRMKCIACAVGNAGFADKLCHGCLRGRWSYEDLQSAVLANLKAYKLQHAKLLQDLETENLEQSKENERTENTRAEYMRKLQIQEKQYFHDRIQYEIEMAERCRLGLQAARRIMTPYKCINCRAMITSFSDENNHKHCRRWSLNAT